MRERCQDSYRSWRLGSSSSAHPICRTFPTAANGTAGSSVGSEGK
uniref:Uncharacterized protein n=1 Tax=Arundo donax TaxID=35708 RepID=A0A0A8YB45_ARUDO